MTPEQAVQILNMAAQSAAMTRMQHIQAQEAVTVLTGLLEKLSKNSGIPQEEHSEQHDTTN